MSKRKFNDDETEEKPEISSLKPKKHTLDSDEEDSGDDEKYNVLDDNDIEGEETGVAGIVDDVKVRHFFHLKKYKQN